MNAIPIAPCAAAANSQYPAVVFHRADVDLGLIVFHCRRNLSAVGDHRYWKRPISNSGQLASQAATHGTKVRVSRTCDGVGVDHAGRLHQSVADRGGDGLESGSPDVGPPCL